MNRRDKEVDDLLAEIDALRLAQKDRGVDITRDMRDMRESLQRIEAIVRANTEKIRALGGRADGRSDPDADAS